MERVVLWDFDGTLARRPGMWRGALIETLDEHEPGHGIEAETLRPYLRHSFPWHDPEVAHPELSEPEAWWAQVEPLLAAAYVGAGIAPERSAALAKLAHGRYVDPFCRWELYPDTLAALEGLRSRGWHHVILSNHVPELPVIVDALGLSPHVELVITSARIGFEKPHPEAFAYALERCGAPTEVWMVGDNPVADVGGAEAAGIPAILVRSERAPDLTAAAAIIVAGEPA